MFLALLIILSQGVILTMAPAIRYHTDISRFEFSHWTGVFVWIVTFAFLHFETTKELKNRDPYLLPIISVLTGIGLLTIWRLYPNFGLKQSIWLMVAGLIVVIGNNFQSYLDYLRRYKYLWLLLGIILTALTIIIGTNPSGNGPKLWLEFFGLHFQPSELLKLLLVIFMAGYFADRVLILRGKLQNLLPTLFVNGIAVLLLISQRDLGTATIFIMIYLAMLFASDGNKWMLWITPILFLISGIAGYLFIDVVQVRINTWLMPFRDPSGASYQIIQSWIAIAEGKLIGTGPGLGSPAVIPVSLSDFIFSAVAEESGFLGALLIIILLILFLYRSLRIALLTKNTFHRYLTLGLIFFLGFQSIMIIGGNLGLLPLTGVTLPFVSYGGSSLVVSFFILLILLTISHRTSITPGFQHLKQKRFAWMGGILISLLAIEIIATSLLAFWFEPSLVARAQNPRWIVDDRFVERGDIVDRENQVIATNAGEVGNYQRFSTHIPLYPIIGYSNPIYGQTGIESSMYLYLRGLQGYSFSSVFWQDILYNQPPQGLNVRMTIDLDLQKSADEWLGELPGAVILLNANSGEILVMASHPYFDARMIEEEWENLVNDSEAPLINRVTQGVYPPGTSLLPFILTSQIEINGELSQFDALLSDSRVKNSCVTPKEEDLTWSSLVSQGCLYAQEILGQNIGYKTISQIYQKFGFFSEPNLHLIVAETDPSSIEEGPDFFRGESPFSVSPLQMALAASAITNNGVLPGPRITNAYQNPNGNWVTLPKLSSNQQVLSSEITNQVIDIIKFQDRPYWQATAIVDTNTENVTWFVAGTTPEWPGQPLSLVVLLETADPLLATEIGQSLLEESLQNLSESAN